MSNTVISTKSYRVPIGATMALSALAISPRAKVSTMSGASAQRANVLENLGLRKIDQFVFGLAAIWCAVAVAEIILRF